jgi:predicted regulator of Ras-like GTPase activity (Roadblock/LC7/MglB family)
MLPQMDAQQAISDLTEISSQIQAAVVFDDKGKVAGSTFADAGRAEELARAAADLLAQAERVKTGDGELNQLEAATAEGSVFVVRDGKTRIAAITAPEPTVGLVFYDLKSALRQVKAAPRPRRKPAAKRPVRASGPGEAVPAEPGASPARKRTPAKKTTATTPKRKTTPRKKKPDAS